MKKVLNCDIDNPCIVTIPRLKEIIKAITGNTGLTLSKNAPYWVNSDQISYLEQSKDHVIEGMYKNVRVTEKQKESLDNWIESLKDKYLR